LLCAEQMLECYPTGTVRPNGFWVVTRAMYVAMGNGLTHCGLDYMVNSHVKTELQSVRSRDYNRRASGEKSRMELYQLVES
jgi:hypothetical protein